MNTYNITIFKSIKETNTPFYREAHQILERIKDGASKELVKKIRLEKNKSERNEMKKMLPSICFSGTFNKRADTSIIEHSGLVCLDFDGYEKQKDLLQSQISIRFLRKTKSWRDNSRRLQRTTFRNWFLLNRS